MSTLIGLIEKTHMLKGSLDFFKNKWILQPFLIAAYVALTNILDFGWSYIKWNEILLLLVCIVVYWAIIFILLKLIFKNKDASCFIATFVVFTSILFEPIHNSFLFIDGLRDRYMVLIITILFFIILYLIIKLFKKFIGFPQKMIVFLNCLFIILNIFTVLEIISKEKPNEKLKINFTSKAATQKHPDIYLIIPDGYAKPKNLKKYCGFDDSTFVNRLSKLGFYCAENPKSNYCYTIQTVASMLNLDYLGDAEKWSDGIILHEIKNSKTIGLLKQEGYDIKNFSLSPIDDKNRKYIDSALYNTLNFKLYVFSKTVFFSIKKIFDSRHKATLENLENVVEREQNINKELLSVIKARDNKQKFVFYHSMITHLPYYINDFGMIDIGTQNRNLEQENVTNWISSKKGTNTFGTFKKDSLWMNSYLNAIKYSNTIVLQLVNKIIEDNQNPSIIIIMSDHGFRFLAGHSFQDTESERYDNFCAVYFPDKHYESLYDSITPINVMRAVLNKAVSTEFKRIPDRSGLSYK